MNETMKLEFVWGNLTEKLRKEVIDFWKSEHAILDEERAKKRADELVAVCRKSNKLIGVSTHVKHFYPPLQNHFHLMRTYVKESERKQGVMKELFKMVWDTFNEKEIYKEQGIVGIMGVMENSILNNKNAAVWSDYGHNVLIGLDSRGFQIRASYFAGAQLTLPNQA